MNVVVVVWTVVAPNSAAGGIMAGWQATFKVNAEVK